MSHSRLTQFYVDVSAYLHGKIGSSKCPVCRHGFPRDWTRRASLGERLTLHGFRGFFV